MPIVRISRAPDYLPLTLAAIRDLRHYSRPRVTSRGKIIEGNGYAAAFLKDGGRVFVDTDRYFEILFAKNGRQCAHEGLHDLPSLKKPSPEADEVEINGVEHAEAKPKNLARARAPSTKKKKGGMSLNVFSNLKKKKQAQTRSNPDLQPLIIKGSSSMKNGGAA